MTIEKIAEGVYFVPSYSVSTLEGYQSGITNQGVSVGTPGDVNKQTLDQESQSIGDVDSSG